MVSLPSHLVHATELFNRIGNLVNAFNVHKKIPAVQSTVSRHIEAIMKQNNVSL